MNLEFQASAAIAASATFCFPGNSQVLTRTGAKSMKELKRGEEVLCRVGEKLQFSEVYMFGHHKPGQEFDCLQLQTMSATISLSPGHYIPVVSEDGVETMKQAKEVIEGDQVLVADHNSLIRQKVEVISECKGQGLYAPFTIEGTVLVDNVLASCYEETVPPAMAHTLLYPVRELYKKMPKSLASLNSKTSEYGVPQWIVDRLEKMAPQLENPECLKTQSYTNFSPLW